jgi:hypothetical protein
MPYRVDIEYLHRGIIRIQEWDLRTRVVGTFLGDHELTFWVQWM